MYLSFLRYVAQPNINIMHTSISFLSRYNSSKLQSSINAPFSIDFSLLDDSFRIRRFSSRRNQSGAIADIRLCSSCSSSRLLSCRNVPLGISAILLSFKAKYSSFVRLKNESRSIWEISFSCKSMRSRLWWLAKPNLWMPVILLWFSRTVRSELELESAKLSIILIWLNDTDNSARFASFPSTVVGKKLRLPDWTMNFKSVIVVYRSKARHNGSWAVKSFLRIQHSAARIDWPKLWWSVAGWCTQWHIIFILRSLWQGSTSGGCVDLLSTASHFRGRSECCVPLHGATKYVVAVIISTASRRAMTTQLRCCDWKLNTQKPRNSLNCDQLSDQWCSLCIYVYIYVERTGAIIWILCFRDKRRGFNMMLIIYSWNRLCLFTKEGNIIVCPSLLREHKQINRQRGGEQNS